MDTMRGNFGSLAESDGYDPADDEPVRDAPPAAIGQDERRMQVRAYNHWAGLLGDRNFPAIEDLEPENLPDFGPYSVLLDFSAGIEDPGITFLGDRLAAECDIGDGELSTLADVPSRSLLSRITDHYMQILANQAPIGFEAEFVNQRGTTIAYRGILLPYSSDDDTIDFIYGVINWKELADAEAADELLLEIDQALQPRLAPTPGPVGDEELTDWADGPGAEPADERVEAVDGLDEVDARPDFAPLDAEPHEDGGLPLPSFGMDDDEGAAAEDDDDAPAQGPQFGSLLKMPIQPPQAPLDLTDFTPEVSFDEGFEDPFEVVPEEGRDGDAEEFAPSPAEAPTHEVEAEVGREVEPEVEAEVEIEVEAGIEAGIEANAEAAGEAAVETAGELWAADPNGGGLAIELGAGEVEPEHDGATEIELPEIDPSEMELGDWLAAAREMAVAARGSEERTRDALYEAIGRAYDFSLAAAEQPAEFDEILADSGLTMQDRAPMTPVVKLVFGADYDKTRLTEYAAALTHAHRLELPRGGLSDYLSRAEGGLKGVVKAERRLRREEAGKAVEPADAPRHALARKLRALPPQAFDALPADGNEFALVMIRRTDEGEVVLLGEVPDDLALVERAARRLLG
jgi:hypothetical protein